MLCAAAVPAWLLGRSQAGGTVGNQLVSRATREARLPGVGRRALPRLPPAILDRLALALWVTQGAELLL